ncbi:hypothetical protein BDR06DRAFT_954751, partial [Suillus hirtellus]
MENQEFREDTEADWIRYINTKMEMKSVRHISLSDMSDRFVLFFVLFEWFKARTSSAIQVFNSKYL